MEGDATAAAQSATTLPAEQHSNAGLPSSFAPSPAASSLLLSSPPFQEQLPPRRLKGKQRLLAGLQRISSSPSVARLGSSRTRSYNGTGKGSISCISLNSSSSMGYPFGTSLTREYSSGFNTPRTPGALTPGIQIPTLDDRARVRVLAAHEAKTTAAVPGDLRPTTARPDATPGIVEVDEDYFSRPVTVDVRPQRDFNFWRDLPPELRMEVLTYLEPKEIVRASVVCKSWHSMCFDGQLWSVMNTAGFYRDIPAEALVRIVASAGPFARSLNLRGCKQLNEQWHVRNIADSCQNLENISLEGCVIESSAINHFFVANQSLVHVDLSGLAGANDAGMRIIGSHCSRLELLNVSWCENVTTRGLRKVISGCPLLKDLRAGETRGWADTAIMQDLFSTNRLERLVLMNCDTLTDESFAILIQGTNSDIDFLTGRPMVPPRKLRHLDITHCRHVTDQGLRSLVNNIPAMEGLQLSRCREIVDATLIELFPTVPLLTHLDLEELDKLTNECLQALSDAPFAAHLKHLNISYCENVGDAGMLPVLKTCTDLRSVEMDNTRVGDLVLAEAASMVKRRSPSQTVQGTIQIGQAPWKPAIGLRIVAYDCQNVTWTGIGEILAHNADYSISTHTTALPPLHRPVDSGADLTGASAADGGAQRSPSPRIHIVRSTTFPSEIIQLKCFYNYQPTVDEHTKRVLRGDFMAAKRLERKWHEFMIAQTEAGTAGAGSRRRRRRTREAQMMHADEEETNALAGAGIGAGRRRRARSGVDCRVM